MPEPSCAAPIVVIGMHRSGTSLVTRILRAAGVDMGADGNVHDESELFLGLNQEIFRAAHAEWDWPLALLPALEDEALCRNLVARLEEALRSKEARAFAGRRFGRVDLLSREDRWGWKDPRNTGTLPLWRKVFPEARVVNVLRDGVDVAASLVTRERKRAGRLHNAARSSRCLSPEGAFELWTEYLTLARRHTDGLAPDRLLHVRYERLVEKPAAVASELLRFVGAPADAATVERAVADVEPGRSAAREPEWTELRRAVADHPLLRAFEAGETP